MSCLFSLFKFFYTTLTILVLAHQLLYIYQYMQHFDAKTFFSNNQFAHSMAMFLGLLFRLSGMLSAFKEKISLTTTYCLFLVLLLLISNKIDDIFYLNAGTAVCAVVFVVVLKYRRAKKRQSRRHNQARGQSGADSESTTPNTNYSATNPTGNQVSIDLMHGSTLNNGPPSAPPYEYIHHQTNNSSTVMGHYNSNAPPPPLPSNDPYYNPQQNTPPPSYSELYEKK